MRSILTNDTGLLVKLLCFTHNRLPILDLVI